MRRPHVYERSAPRRRRDEGVAPGVDPAEAARGVARALPALVAMAESANLAGLASLLDAAWAEAERIEDEAGRA
ncbi:hypothetical protein D3273_15570 [Lichenibacterium minor]|uniref:Uncharacterized protein n=1 Tax=Lichenibacterium minor TaxID=2316528 RepID=A0A4Q2U8C3_9HYPH|nr:hypothetical protein [Lichenibacterium minor]RYC31125.1 hypothetical protein D3273_15570 [Lichenibacterium minor]